MLIKYFRTPADLKLFLVSAKSNIKFIADFPFVLDYAFFAPFLKNSKKSLDLVSTYIVDARI